MSTEANPTPRDEPEPLAGTVKPYRRHLAVCTGGPPELWAARVEEMEGLFAALHAALAARELHKQVKVTACDAPSLSDEGFDLFLMPDMLVLPGVTPDRVEALVSALHDDFARGLPFDVRPMAGGDHLFVCVHANRDARCGEWGPPLHAALRREIEAQGAIAHVHQSSHVGGHRFAATCIVYPQGIWYGNLRPADAFRLVAEHLNEERLLPDHYRGRLGTTSCQQVAEATAARALLQAYPAYESLEVRVEEANGIAHARARAIVRGPDGFTPVEATFTLSCPVITWSADDEPIFVTR